MAALTFEAEAPLSAIALSPGGTMIAGALKNGRIRIWSTAGKPVSSFATDGPAVLYLVFATDNRLLVGSAHAFSLVDTAGGRRLAAFEVRDLESVAASPDLSLLGAASDDGTIRLWKGDGTPLRSLGGGLAEMLGVAIASGGGRVAGGGAEADVRIYDAKSGATLQVLNLPMCCPILAFSPDARALAAGSVDGSITLWDVKTGRRVAELGRYGVPAGALRFSRDGRHLAAAGVSMNPSTAPAEVTVWDLSSRKAATTALGVATVTAVGFDPMGRPLAVGGRERSMSVRAL